MVNKVAVVWGIQTSQKWNLFFQLGIDFLAVGVEPDINSQEHAVN
jgi:hypothetical protein